MTHQGPNKQFQYQNILIVNKVPLNECSFYLSRHNIITIFNCLLKFCYQSKVCFGPIQVKALHPSKLTIIIAINHFVIIVNFRNRFDKAFTEIFLFHMSLAL